ncbi:MAG: protease inhibitor I9 family protein [Pseudomonadota bacterium]
MYRAFASFLITLIVLGPAFAPTASAARPHADINSIQPVATRKSTKWVRLPSEQEPDSGGEHRYIVQFDDEPLPLYEGGIVGLAPTNPGGGKLNTTSAAARAYVAHLQQRQTDMVNDMSAQAGSITVERTHQHALNAVTVRMTEAAANKVRNLPGVTLVVVLSSTALSRSTSLTPGRLRTLLAAASVIRTVTAFSACWCVRSTVIEPACALMSLTMSVCRCCRCAT